MNIRFYNISENDFFDKVLETLPVFYPRLLSINIYAEDGTHNLPTHTEELFSKTVSFLKNIYFSNQTVSIAVIETDNETDVTLNYKEGFQEYQTCDLDIDLIFKHLYPLEILTEKINYYSFEASNSVKTLYFKSEETLQLHSTHIDDYCFNYNSRMYRKFFTFTQKDEHTFSYFYKTFLPEAVQPDHLIRLILLSLGFQHEIFTRLRFFKKSQHLQIDKSELTTHKHILFNIPTLSISGSLAPITKTVKVVQND